MIDTQAGHPGNSRWTVDRSIHHEHIDVLDGEGNVAGSARFDGSWWITEVGKDRISACTCSNEALQDIFDKLWSRVTGIEFYRKPWPKFAPDKRKKAKAQRA